MYNYILIEGVASYRLILIDRNKYKIIEINTLSNEIKDITKEIFKYYNKYDLVGFSIFKAFIDGDYSKYDLVKKSNNLKETDIPFNLNSYYSIFNSLPSKERKRKKVYYDKENKHKFIFREDEKIPLF